MFLLCEFSNKRDLVSRIGAMVYGGVFMHLLANLRAYAFTHLCRCANAQYQHNLCKSS